MSHLLGLHLNLNKLTPIERYNRSKLFSTIHTSHICLAVMGHLALNYLTEIGDIRTDILEPEYQIPNIDCAFHYDTEDENILYTLCTDIYSNFCDAIILSLHSLSSCI